MPTMVEPETSSSLERSGGGGGKSIGTMAPKRPGPPKPPTAEGYEAPGWSAWLLVLILIAGILLAAYGLWLKVKNS